MALVLADRVRDTTTTTGTGTITLSGTAPTGYQNFSVVGNGNTTYYTINAASQWEVGIGTYSSTGPTLSRDTVLASSNAGSLVSFSSGTKDVFITYPAEKSVNYDASNNVGIGTTTPAGKFSSNTGASGTYSSIPGNVNGWDSTVSLFGAAGSSTGAAIGIGMTSAGGYISALAPSVAWQNLYYQASTHYWYNGVTQLGILNTSGDFTALGSVRSPIFYDLNNTAYYVDPASTSSMNTIQGSQYSVGFTNPFDAVNASPWYGLGRSNVDGGTPSNTMVQLAGYYGLRLRSQSYILDIQGSSGVPFSFNDYGQFAGSVRAPIFYDSNNTAYYVSPDDISNFNQINFGDSTKFIRGGASGQIILGAGSANDAYIQVGGSYYPIWNSGNFTPGNYMPISGGTFTGTVNFVSAAGTNGFITGTGDGANTSTYNFALSGWNGMAFYNPTSGGAFPYTASGVMDFRNGSMQMRGDFRAPIFYDSNNTAYYLDAAGNSVFSAFNIGGGEVYFYGSATNAVSIRTGAGGAYRYFTFDASGNFYALNGSVYGDRFYDQSNTAYYVDPAGTSNLYTVVTNAQTPAIAFKGDIDGAKWMQKLGGYNLSFMNDGGAGFDSVSFDGRTYYNKFYLDNSGNAYAYSSFRAPIFYDSNNTAYYLDPTGTSQVVTMEASGGSGFRSFGTPSASITSQIYFCNTNNTRAWNWQLDENSLAALWGYDGSGWSKTLTIAQRGAGVYLRNSSGADILAFSASTFGYSSAYRTLILGNQAYTTVCIGVDPVANASGSFNGAGSGVEVMFKNGVSFITPNSANNSYLTPLNMTDGYVTSSGSFRAPIFYDSNDTSYYVDPNSTSVINGINVGSSTPLYSSGSFQYHQHQSPHVAYVKKTGGYSWYWRRNDTGLAGGANEVENMSLTEGGTLAVNGDMRAPIFYDSNNTGYYINPNGTSNIYQLTGAITYGSYGSFSASGTYNSYAGIAFPDVSATLMVGNGSSQPAGFYFGNSAWGLYCYSAGHTYTKIVYDLDNTAYYVDPNGTSNFAGLTVANTITGSVSGGSGYAGYVTGTNLGKTGSQGFFTTSSWTAADWANLAIGGGGMTIYNTPGQPAGNNYGFFMKLGNRDAGGPGWGGIWMDYDARSLWYGATTVSSSFATWYKTVAYGYNTSGTIYATDFYDNGNTAFFVDPSGTSQIANLTVYAGLQWIKQWGGTAASPTEVYDWPYPALTVSAFGNYTQQTMLAFALPNDGNYFTGDSVWNFRLNQTANSTTSAGVSAMNFGGPGVLYLNPSSYTQTTGSMRAPMFYDSDDTGYYLNLNGYSQHYGFGNTGTASGTGFNVMGNPSNGAIMAFHRASAYAINMGLDSDNVFRLGGWSAAANRLQMDMSGNLTMAGNVTAYSDARLKKDVETIEGALDLVAKMRGVRYTRIDTEKRGTGVIAQEMLEVMPEVVQQGVGDDDTLSVAYGNLVGVMIEAIKELTARVTELEGK